MLRYAVNNNYRGRSTTCLVTTMTLDEYKQYVKYDPDTGLFTRIVNGGGTAKAGDLAGHKHCQGYLCVTAKNKAVLAHRLAWLFMTGEWPKGVIDHKDRDKTNNRWANLRGVTMQENSFNQGARTTNRLGVKGVSTVGSRYMAQIMVNGKNIYLGCHDTVALAEAAYRAAATIYHKG